MWQFSRQFNTRATQLPPALTSCCILQSGGLGGDRTDGQGQVHAAGARAGGLVLLQPGGQDLPTSRVSSALSLTEKLKILKQLGWIIREAKNYGI